MKRIFVYLIVCLLASGCESSSTPDDQLIKTPDTKSSGMKLELNKFLLSLVNGQYTKATWTGRNVLLKVEQPDHDFAFEGAAGIANFGSEVPMTTDHQFMISSITKNFVSTLILQMWEEGVFGDTGLDTTLGELAVFDKPSLDVINIYQNKSYGAEITLRHLLTHSAGLGTGWREIIPGSVDNLDGVFARYWECKQDPDCDPEVFYPNKTWARWDPSHPFVASAGLFNNYLVHQRETSDSIAKPGEMYAYRDLNFWILAIIAQTKEDQPLYKILRKRIFDPLNMDKTYMLYTQDSSEENHRVALSDFYDGDVPVVSSGFNFSMDWAGGGLVTTLDELSRYHRALVNGDLFQHASTYLEMSKWHGEPQGEYPYKQHIGLGYFTTELFGVSVIGHTGFMGAFMYHHPESNTFITGTLNNVPGDAYEPIMADLLEILSLKN